MYEILHIMWYSRLSENSLIRDFRPRNTSCYRKLIPNIPKIIKAINPKQDKMLLVDSIETVFYVIIPTSV